MGDQYYFNKLRRLDAKERHRRGHYTKLEAEMLEMKREEQKHIEMLSHRISSPYEPTDST